MIGVNVCVLGTIFYDWCECVSVLGSKVVLNIALEGLMCPAG